MVYGDARAYADAEVCGNAVVENADSIIFVFMQPHAVTITPQNIVIGCQLRSRFGKNQWKLSDQFAKPKLIEIYKPLLSYLKKQVPRKKAK